MNTLQSRSIAYYTALATKPRHMVTTAGRYAKDASKIKYIWLDILEKLALRKGMSLLDIGSGFGAVTRRCLHEAKRLNLLLTMMDIAPIIHAVKEELLPLEPGVRVTLRKGIFPEDCPAAFLGTVRFDRLLLYSVLSLTSTPLKLIDAGVRLLKPGGRFLIGDIANMSKKGRFLSSAFGRQFEARYRGVSIKKVPLYRTHHDYLAKNRSHPNRIFDDQLVSQVVAKYRHRGYDVYVLPQAPPLPFSYTREDILICRPAR